MALGFGLLAVIYRFIRPLGLLILGISITALLAPLISWLSRRMARIIAVVLVYLALVLLLAGLGMVIIVGAVPTVGVALLQSPTKAIIVLVYAILLHQVESNILVPNIMRTQTELSPLLVLLALAGGLTIGGIFGALVAIPLTAALRVVFIEQVFPAIRRPTGA